MSLKLIGTEKNSACFHGYLSNQLTNVLVADNAKATDVNVGNMTCLKHA
jgi:hypothetical protein